MLGRIFSTPANPALGEGFASAENMLIEEQKTKSQFQNLSENTLETYTAS